MIGIIFNPTARGDKAQQFRESLTALDADVRVLPTRGPNDARVLAAELAQEGLATIVAAGGDGTVNEVLNGICDSANGLQHTRLAVIPLGTVNVFAKELGLPERLDQAWQVIRAGHERTVDLPHAEFTGLSGGRERRHFILMAGAGLGARAVERVDWNLKKKFGPLAYLWAGKQAMRPPHPLVQVVIDHQPQLAPMVEIGSGRYFGGRFVLFPGAQIDDGQLYALLVPRLSWFRLARFFLYVVTRQLKRSPDARLLPARAIALSADTPMPFHLDGDWVGQLPATITIQRQVLRVVVP